MSGTALQRQLDDLELQLKGLVHVRALLETNGASPDAVALHSDAINRVRGELIRLARTRLTTRGDG
ncbi:MAG TPA: hypothetical protein VH816_14415 [Gaiellaceae bacterium]